jgi:hypothetical protein
MQLAHEVKTFTGASERLLSTITMNRALSEDEARIIEYYCKELLAKIAPRLPELSPLPLGVGSSCEDA